ncbi:hypothetical protein BHU72_04790 [Desulfuribacillus stibiiarsenatis]|uniref:Rhodanese domain-containing protein n=1 Tax=Desulfuribacillus stibiiarsenatis TaxID=1390249 RepID=A0A1E5L5L3_9FIRM|nr:rhodanese-like domain-containing protein [Desulfuribacillus stibiiarsenatis]OEH85410.1 hypothetical protein BHU72_04790 [Desulfuribacillus stibiiarsenatis]
MLKKLLNMKALLLILMLGLALTLTGCEELEAMSAGASAPTKQVQVPAGITNAVPIKAHLNYVTTEEVMVLMKSVKPASAARTKYEQAPPEWNFVLVDSRPFGKYAEGHINGAINIPEEEFEKFKDRLPTDKNTKLIFYCGGWACPLSSASAEKAIALGYTDVSVFQAGTDHGWSLTNNYYVITPEYLAPKIQNAYMSDVNKKPFKLIDARPYTSYFESHIPMAYPMDDELFSKKYLSTMPTDKSTEIIIYCGGFFCSKSHNVAKELTALGYTNVKVLAGGLPAWKEAKLPTFGTATGGVSFDINAGKKDPGLTPIDWKAAYDKGGVIVVDVRTADERAAGAIPNSIHIPSGEINASPAVIAEKIADKNATILIHCASGARAAGVIDKFLDQGYKNAVYLKTGIKIAADGTFSF